jgi:type IV pilus assembly protein PilB
LAGLPEEADLEAFIAAYALQEPTFLLELRVLDGEVPEERLIDLLYWGSDERAIVPAEIRSARQAMEVLQGEELDLLRQAVRTGRDTARVLVRLALDRGASDIHVEPMGEVTRVRLRVGGTLQTVARLNPDDWEAIALAVKSVAGMRTERALGEQKGAFTVRDEKTGRTTDCRVSIMPAAVPGARGDIGEFVTIRLLEQDVVDRSLSQLGLEGRAYALLQEAVQEGSRGAWGLVVMSGPTGSGKTTTLYATLRQLDLDHSTSVLSKTPSSITCRGSSRSASCRRFPFRPPFGLSSARTPTSCWSGRFGTGRRPEPLWRPP